MEEAAPPVHCKSKSCRVSLFWRKRQQVNSTVSFCLLTNARFQLYLPFQQFAAMSWRPGRQGGCTSGWASQLTTEPSGDCTGFSGMVTKHCKGRDLQERCGAEARFGFNGQAQIRSNVDGLFYLFLVLLLLPSVVRSQETPLNPLAHIIRESDGEGTFLW